MVNAIIIHGSNAAKDEHWYPWLEKQLEEDGFEVLRLQFPIHEEQHLESWVRHLEPHKDKLEGSMVTGHSLGAPFLLNILQDWDVHVKAAFFVGGFTGYLHRDGAPYLNEFSDKHFDWSTIKKHCDRFVVIHGDDDSRVPLDKGTALAHNLGVEVTVVKGGKHFLSTDGYDAFPLLLQKIREYS